VSSILLYVDPVEPIVATNEKKKVILLPVIVIAKAK